MGLVPELDLGPRPEDEQRLPNNLEAEQALLGAILYDNVAYEKLPSSMGPADFFEPFHQRLYRAIERIIRTGHLAEPILLSDEFRGDPAFEELGGLRYLADMVDRAPPASNAPDYARSIIELSLRRNLIGLGENICKTARNPDGETPARQQIESAERSLYELVNNKVESGLETFDHILTGALEMAAAAYTRDGTMAGLPSGLIDLDKKLGGLRPGNLIVLAARPSMGKTALAVNIAFHTAKTYQYVQDEEGLRTATAGGVVALFSLEMPGEELGIRILSEASGISADRITRGEIEAVEFGRLRDAAEEIQAAPLYTDATSAITLAAMRNKARRLQRTVGLGLIVVDYLQLMTTGSERHQAPHERVSEITAGLKALAKDLNVPIIALSQLSRDVEKREDKRPQLSDLRESGSIEQDADVVLFLYREAYYLGRSQPKEGSAEHMAWEEEMDKVKHLAEVIIGKQRHGAIGTVKVSFNPDLTKFGNWASEDRYAAQ